MALLAARGLARLVALVLTAALAVAGLTVAVFTIQGDSMMLSLPNLARHAQLGHLLGDVGDFLASLEAEGGVTAKIAALAGAGAVLLGLLLMFGVLAPRRERLIVMRRDDAGTVAARPRALGQAAATLAEQSRDVRQVKARIGARRRGTGGRLRVTVYGAAADRAAATAAVRDRVQALAGGFALRLRVRGRRSPRRARAV
jgi:HAMP domain-containing protein